MIKAVSAYERINEIYDRVEAELNQSAETILESIRAVVKDPDNYDKRADKTRIGTGYLAVNGLFEFLQSAQGITVLSHHNAFDSFLKNYVQSSDDPPICETFGYLTPAAKNELIALFELWVLMDDLVDVQNVSIHRMAKDFPEFKERKAFYEKEIDNITIVSQ